MIAHIVYYNFDFATLLLFFSIGFLC